MPFDLIDATYFTILLIELELADFSSLLVPGILSEACHEGALGGRVYFSSFMCARKWARVHAHTGASVYRRLCTVS